MWSSGRRFPAARQVEDAAPKLRAKGAAAALQALLDEDSLSAATKLPELSERGARRLFERLVALGAVRELTGRQTFRLYGLLSNGARRKADDRRDREEVSRLDRELI